MSDMRAASCNLSIDMVFRATLFGSLVTKVLRARLVDEFSFGYNEPVIIYSGQRSLEAL